MGHLKDNAPKLLALRTRASQFDARRFAPKLRETLMARLRAETGATLSARQLLATLEIGCEVALHSNDVEWLQFLQTGKLPAFLPVKPRQMEHIRGGTIATGRVAPVVVVQHWCSAEVPDRKS